MKKTVVLIVSVILCAALLIGCTPALAVTQSPISKSTLAQPTEPAAPPTVPDIPSTKTPCNICGEYDCDDGAFCDDWDDRREHNDDHKHRRRHHS